MKVLNFQHSFIVVFLCIFFMFLSSGACNDPLKVNLRKLEISANDALNCYIKARHFSSTHRGGPLWNEIRKVLVQTNPRKTPTNLRNKDCLTGLDSLWNPLREIIRTDRTVGVCKDTRTVKNNIKRVKGELKDTISYYTSTLNVVKSAVSVQLNMTALTNLAKSDARNLVLNNGRRGVPADVLRNLQILDLIYMMAKKLKLNCI